MRQRANARSEEHSRVFSAAVLRCSVVAPVQKNPVHHDYSAAFPDH